MKCVKLAAIFAFTLAGSHSAMALDIQPGEWAREGQGKTIHTCYTEKMAANLKKLLKVLKVLRTGVRSNILKTPIPYW